MLLHVINNIEHAVIYASDLAVLWYAYRLVRMIIPIPPLSMLFSRAHKEEMKVRVVESVEVQDDPVDEWNARFREHCVVNGIDQEFQTAEEIARFEKRLH